MRLLSLTIFFLLQETRGCGAECCQEIVGTSRLPRSLWSGKSRSTLPTKITARIDQNYCALWGLRFR